MYGTERNVHYLDGTSFTERPARAPIHSRSIRSPQPTRHTLATQLTTVNTQRYVLSRVTIHVAAPAARTGRARRARGCAPRRRAASVSVPRGTVFCAYSSGARRWSAEQRFGGELAARQRREEREWALARAAVRRHERRRLREALVGAEGLPEDCAILAPHAQLRLRVLGRGERAGAGARRCVVSCRPQRQMPALHLGFIGPQV